MGMIRVKIIKPIMDAWAHFNFTMISRERLKKDSSISHKEIDGDGLLRSNLTIH